MGWLASLFGEGVEGEVAASYDQLRHDFRRWCQRLGDGRLNPDDPQQLGWWLHQHENSAALNPDGCPTCGGMETLLCPVNCTDDWCTLCGGQGSIECPACVGVPDPKPDGIICLTCRGSGGLPCACGGLTEECRYCEDGIILCEYCNHRGYGS